MNLSDRMKEYYEKRSRIFLTRKSDVILRLDGKAFHTYTRHFRKPYDRLFHEAMNQTALYLAKQIQGCKVAYTQSDEITLLLTDYDSINTDAWFEYNVQKMCSVAASMATAFFNQIIVDNIRAYSFSADLTDKNEEEYIHGLNKTVKQLALFDCRAFSIPHNEVINCFIWRQQDCRRNAIQMLGQSHFSRREIHKKSNKEILDMLNEKGIDFEQMPGEFRNGVCCVKTGDEEKKHWCIDNQVPIFSEDKEYIQKHIPKFD